MGNLNIQAIIDRADLVQIATQAGAHLKYQSGEWRGCCPIHMGDNPSAFVIYQHGGKNKWKCYTRDECGNGDVIDFVMKWRRCSFVDACRYLGNGDLHLTPEELAEIEAERDARIEQERITKEQRATHAAQVLNEEWPQYNANLKDNPQARELWRKRGVDDEWQAYYGLGFCPARKWGDYEYQSLTIPYLYLADPDGDAPQWRARQMKYRLLGDDTPGGKYRSVSGLDTCLFHTDLHQRKYYGDVFIVEGEIKAIVTWALMWDCVTCYAPDITVIGLPGKGYRPDPALFADDIIRSVTICLDPDAQKEAGSMAKSIGQKARVLQLPEKIDDLILAEALDRDQLLYMIELARRRNG